MAESLSLRALAAYAGILPGYAAMDGEYRTTSDGAREGILRALGYAAHGARAARETLGGLLAEDRARVLAGTHVVVAGAEARAVRAHVAGAPCQHVGWRLTLALEDGTSREASGRAAVEPRGPCGGVVALDLPVDPPLGYHTLSLTLDAPGGRREGVQRLVVVPPRCASPAAVLGGQRVAGLTASLYTVRSARNWGVGDLTDLGALVDLAADHGGAFVGVNPLHALRTSGAEPSPYGPVSRVYRHLLYLDVDAVPELADDAGARALRDDPALAAALGALRAADRVDHAAVLAAKRPALDALHRAFRRLPAGRARRRAYDAFAAAQGEALDAYATFQALDEHFRAAGCGWWGEWPAELQDAGSDAVRAFAREHAEGVDFHRWAQFELDAQLAAAAARARARGLPVGLYQDLAVGVSPAGGDVWADPPLFARGASLGAPPDPLGPDGQNWGLPPMNPRRLAAAGYAPWTRLVRSAMRHAGALRIDHAIGLFRQFWISEGSTGRDGAYVRMPADDLLGILALESVRANGGAGALVVGEDLGTVPPEVGPGLARWGVLSSKVLYFERGTGGSFVPPRTYARTALATVNTHDLATLAGWWQGRDVALRRELGLIETDEAAEAAHADRARERAQLVRLLVDEGVLDAAAVEGVAQGDVPESLPADALDVLTLRAGVHAVIRRAPSWMVGLALEDLVGEVEPVNLPGVGPDRFPSWTRRLRVLLEDAARDPAVARAFGAERVWGGREEITAAERVRLLDSIDAGYAALGETEDGEPDEW